jgi:hypothetical protein
MCHTYITFEQHYFRNCAQAPQVARFQNHHIVSKVWIHTISSQELSAQVEVLKGAPCSRTPPMMAASPTPTGTPAACSAPPAASSSARALHIGAGVARCESRPAQQVARRPRPALLARLHAFEAAPHVCLPSCQGLLAYQQKCCCGTGLVPHNPFLPVRPTQGLQQKRLKLNYNSAACLNKPSQAGCPPDAWCKVSAHGRTYARAAQFPSTMPAHYDQLCVPACTQAGPHLDGLAADQHVLQLRAQLAVQRVGLLAPLRAKLDHALHQAG